MILFKSRTMPSMSYELETGYFGYYDTIYSTLHKYCCIQSGVVKNVQVLWSVTIASACHINICVRFFTVATISRFFFFRKCRETIMVSNVWIFGKIFQYHDVWIVNSSGTDQTVMNFVFAESETHMYEYKEIFWHYS